MGMDQFACIVLKKPGWMSRQKMFCYVSLAYVYAFIWFLLMLLPDLSFLYSVLIIKWDYQGAYGDWAFVAENINDYGVVICLLIWYISIKIKMRKEVWS